MARAGSGGDGGDGRDGRDGRDNQGLGRQRPRQRPGADGGARRTQRPPSEREPDYAALVGSLLDELAGSAITRLELRQGDLRLMLRRVPGAGTITLPAAAVPPSAQQAPDRPDHWHAVAAPLTGIFYAKPSPDEAPFVTVGGHVDADQVVGLIESMKMYNEVTADMTGIVSEIVAQSGELIEAGQPIIYIEQGEGPQGPPEAG